MDSPQSGRTIQFQFNGKAGEYFKIWIVNIALSIITLGIYSPWAKVRTKRYFYGNTTLDGSSFDYLGDPLLILKGRMLVFAVILVYAVTTQYIPLLEFAFLILYMIALPWMVIKSMQFNTRNSAYRNIRFNFDGKLSEAAFIFIGLSIFTMLTLGLAMPYLIKRFKQFTVEHSYFGTSKFDFHASGGSFYMIYFKALAIPFIIGILAAIAIPAYQGYVNTAKQMQNPQQFEMPQQQTPPDTEDAPVTDPESARPNNGCNPAAPPGRCPSQTGNGEASALGALVSFLVLAFYLLLGVYIRTRTDNLVLNNASLSTHQLESTLRVRDMFFIYLTNIIAALLSLGLLIPWARIRLTRYRLAHTALIAHGELSGFVADELEAVSATGGEFTSAFDVDLGF
jgi:uncharacterized membrane protein YjgN (DUF898 family)